MSRRQQGIVVLAVAAIAIAGWLLATSDARTRALFWTTARLAAATCAISVPIGSVVAVITFRTDVPGRRMWLVLLGAVLLLPLYLQAAAWQSGFGLEGWFTLTSGTQWLTGFSAVVWIHALAAIPWVVLIVGASLMTGDADLEESALLDADAHRVLGLITLRRVWHAALLAAVWVAISTAGEITVTDFYRVRTYAEEVFSEATFQVDVDQQPLDFLPGALGTAVLVLAAVALATYLLPRVESGSARRMRPFRLGRMRALAFAAILICLTVTLFVPAASLVIKAGATAREGPAGLERTWELRHLVALMIAAPRSFQREFTWSFLIGSFAALAAVALATLAVSWSRRSGPRTVVVMALVSMVWAVPSAALGLFVIRVCSQSGIPLLNWLYNQSIFAPGLVQMLKATPLTLAVLWPLWRTLGSDVLESAELEGAGFWSRLLRIELPQRRAAIGLALIVALDTAIGELAATHLVLPPGVETLTDRIYTELHYGLEDRVAAVCLLLVAMYFGLVLTAGALVRGAWRNEQSATSAHEPEMLA